MTGSRRRVGLRRGRAALLGAIAASAVMAFGVSSAQAAPTAFTATFDDAALNVGVTFDILDPPQTATLSATDWDKGGTNDFTNGTLSPLSFSGDAVPGVPVSVAFSALTPITGHLDPATGAMTTSGTYRAVVSVLGSTCTYDNPLPFATSGGFGTISGDPFTVTPGPPDTLTNGVLVTSWPGLPPANPAIGDCGLVNGLVAGPGGIAIANGFDLTPDSTPATSTTPPVTRTLSKRQRCIKKAKKIKDKDKRKKALKKCKKKKKKK